jgi:hypothetical protein
MPKNHRPYPAEYRQRLIDLVRKGRAPEELAWQFEPSAQRNASERGRGGTWNGEPSSDLCDRPPARLDHDGEPSARSANTE